MAAPPADIANAALAGGVAIGSTCDIEGFFTQTFIIGITAGVVSTFGFAVIQGKLQSLLKKTDTCGVLYLHGLPGLLGGLVAVACTTSPTAQSPSPPPSTSSPTNRHHTTKRTPPRRLGMRSSCIDTRELVPRGKSPP